MLDEIITSLQQLQEPGAAAAIKPEFCSLSHPAVRCFGDIIIAHLSNGLDTHCLLLAEDP